MRSSFKTPHIQAAPAESSLEERLAWLMDQQGIPRALFPDGVQVYEVDLETGRFSGRFDGSFHLSTSKGQLRVAAEISCVFCGITDSSEWGRLEKVQGITVEKQLFGLRAVVDVESVCIADRGVVLIHALGPEIVPTERFWHQPR